MHVSARRGSWSPGRALRAGLAARRAACLGASCAALAGVTIVAGAVTIGALPTAAATVPTGAVAASKVTAASVLKAATAAIDKQTSAHVVFAAANSAATAESIVADFGTRGGTETVTDGAAVLTVKVTPTASYVSGSPTGLTNLFGLKAAEAAKVGTRWEYWKSGSAEYANLKKVVTVHSLLSLLPKAKGTTLSAAGPVYTLTWTAKATSKEPALSNTLTVSAHGAKLPMVETSTDAAGVKVTTTVSMWGEKLQVQAPLPASTIAASMVSA